MVETSRVATCERSVALDTSIAAAARKLPSTAVTFGDIRNYLLRICGASSMQNQRNGEATRHCGRVMIMFGFSTSYVARFLGVDPRTVRRWRHLDTSERQPRRTFRRSPRLTEKEMRTIAKIITQPNPNSEANPGERSFHSAADP